MESIFDNKIMRKFLNLKTGKALGSGLRSPCALKHCNIGFTLLDIAEINNCIDMVYKNFI